MRPNALPMKRALLYTCLFSLFFMACRPVLLLNDRPNRPHDNGKHKGWYKHGRIGIPPGQAKKRGWQARPF